MNTERLDYTGQEKSIKYLGFTFSFDKKDDNIMVQQMKTLYTKSNRLLRLFHCFQPLLNLFYFSITVLVFITHFSGLIIQSQLTANCLFE